MHNDLDLLKLAAKAAGYVINFEDYTDPADWFAHGYDDNGDVAEWWNPLKSDGDALRLAVALGILQWVGEEIHNRCGSEKGPDLLAVVRRVIVEYAAEIGKAL